MSYFLIGAGIFTLVCTFLKPDFYWESRKAIRMRKLLGDRGASFFYYGIGIVIIVLTII